ncbi:cadherin-related family member 4-like [Alosa pseudoharengus]|uniref:cadherin-related family member 4-like n=1 Tax=Alosa pseudoharengus TaxID=34774 RepID=UPI003F8C5F9E
MALRGLRRVLTAYLWFPSDNDINYNPNHPNNNHPIHPCSNYCQPRFLREFIDLPDVLEVTESTRPRKVILEFQIASANPDPDVQILSITPDNPVLEDPIVNPTNVSGVFSVQIVLNGSLDYETTNLLTVRLGIKSPSGFVERTFSLSVTDANEPPQCDAHFQLGAVVQVPEDSPAPFSIYEVQPVSSSAQFHIDDKGSITSNQTFDYERGLRLFFSLPSQNVTILENEGSESTVTTYFAAEDGVIKTSYNLDLESDRTLEKSILLVRAFSMSEDRSGTATVTVYVQDVNEHAPLCVPPVIVLTVPETTEVGRSLGTVRCFDVDVSNQNVTLTVVENSLSLFKFRLQDGQLQVNNSLDYDVADVTNFQYEATILAIDSGSPPLTTEVRVLITVTPVNEFDPLFLGPLVIGVPENTRRGSVIASLSAVDRDWPFNSLRYSLLEGERQFSLDPIGGQLYLGVDLDFEIQDQYELKVKAVDFDQDVDKTKQRTGMAQITIMVENVNDNAPECDPVSYESTIFSTLASNTPILTLTCTDRDRDHLTATITSDGVYDDTDYEITISVSDGKHSTSVVAYIYVIPWTTTKPTTTTTTTTKNPEVVTVINEFWDPQPWFVAALTVTGALLLLLLSLPLWIKLFR